MPEAPSPADRSRPGPGPAERSVRGAQAGRLGVAGVLVMYGGLVLLWMLCVPVFGTWDEAANVDYSLQISHGRLPVANSEYDATFPELGQDARGQYVANHAPLFHALAAPFVRLAEGSDHARAYLLLGRGISALCGALLVVVVALTARSLWARSPRAAPLAMVVAAAVVATVPEVVAASGAHRNDAMTALLASVTVLLLLRAVRARLRSRTVVALAVVCTLGMLTRVSFLPVWLLAVGAVVVLTWWPDLRSGRPGRRQLLTGLTRAGAVTALPLLGAGWFYALNLQRYGDLTGGSALYPRVARRDYAPGAEGGPLDYLLTPTTWWTQLQQLGGIRSTVKPDDHPVHTVLAVVVVVVLAAGVAATVARVLRRGRPLLDRRGRWQLLALVLVGVATCAELASHVAHKGAENQRYLINAVTLWGSGTAFLLLGLGRRLVPVAASLLTGVLVVGTVIYTVERVQDLGIRGSSWFGTLVAGFEHTGTPGGAPVVTVLLVTVVVGYVVQLVVLWRLAAPDAPAGGAAMPTLLDALGRHR